MSTIRVWDFVEEYYPKYYSSDEIAENDSLQKIVDGEIEDSAESLFKDIADQLGIEIQTDIEDMDEGQYDEIVLEAKTRLMYSNSSIYELSIERYMEQKDELLLNMDLSVLEEIVFVKKYGKTESELGMLLRMGGIVSVNNTKDLTLAQNNSFGWSEKYKRWFDRLNTTNSEVHILNKIL